jgi:spore maturation protein CgeB
MKILFLNWAPIVKYGMASGFEQLGHETELIDPSEDNYEGMMAHIARFKPDYLFSEGGVGRDGYIIPVIKDSGIPHIYWAIEDPVSYNLSLAYGCHSVLVGTTCVEWINEIYTPNGVKAITVPFACNPNWHKEGTYRKELAGTMAFMGNNYEAHSYRKIGYDTMFKPFIDNHYNINFYGGKEWIDPTFSFHVPELMYRGYLPYESLPDLCKSTVFILGTHSINGSKTMQSMRTFEVLASRGFFLTHHSTAIEAMFEKHKHLVWSSSPEETLDLFNWYHAHPLVMDRIRDEGQQFVYENHTYKHRAQDIIAALKEV